MKTKLKAAAGRLLSPLPKNKILPCLIYARILDIVQELTDTNRDLLRAKFGSLTAAETLKEINRL